MRLSQDDLGQDLSANTSPILQLALFSGPLLVRCECRSSTFLVLRRSSSHCSRSAVVAVTLPLCSAFALKRVHATAVLRSETRGVSAIDLQAPTRRTPSTASWWARPCDSCRAGRAAKSSCCPSHRRWRSVDLQGEGGRRLSYARTRRNTPHGTGTPKQSAGKP